jgi:hypothetical protein
MAVKSTVKENYVLLKVEALSDKYVFDILSELETAEADSDIILECSAIETIPAEDWNKLFAALKENSGTRLLLLACNTQNEELENLLDASPFDWALTETEAFDLLAMSQLERELGGDLDEL